MAVLEDGSLRIDHDLRAATRPDPAEARFEFLTGFEGTHIFGSGWDVLETTEHTTRYRDDLLRLQRDGLTSFRACIPWHRIERERGVYDWSWTDGYLAYVRTLGLTPIVDPLHHTSFPEWLGEGFADPEFGAYYLRFLSAFARRYPWVEHYTIINEPFVTTWFCGQCAVWQPRHEGPQCFVPMLLAVARAICECTAGVARLVPEAKFIHAESCERHSALDLKSVAHAEQGNALRFCVLDLILGRVNREHSLYEYLFRHGMQEADVAWFQDNRARIDVLGLDYYSHSELAWTAAGRASSHPVAGFKAVALDYARRYGCPIMLSETNLRGTVDDRIGWLRYMVGQCSSLADELEALGLSFRGFCWYPYIDSTDWSSLVREARRDIDPQGIYWLDPSFGRNASELSEIYAALARGEVRASDIPMRPFSEGALDGRGVRNFLPQMPWLADVPESRQAVPA
jgi:beta-glucosidase/6-phospho-beta-glucosidase/beta-galactosidase